MTGPAYHGWTHRPKSEGGTDPIPGLGASDLKWARALASNQTITPSGGDYFFSWDFLFSNDATLFEVADVTAGRGDWIQVNGGGFYIAEFVVRGTNVWDNSFYTTITPMVEISGSPFDLWPSMDLPSYEGSRFNSMSEMFAGETAHADLIGRAALHYNPDDPSETIDFEDPLKLSVRAETITNTVAKTLGADMFIYRIADAGYTDLSP